MLIVPVIPQLSGSTTIIRAFKRNKSNLKNAFWQMSGVEPCLSTPKLVRFNNGSSCNVGCSRIPRAQVGGVRRRNHIITLNAVHGVVSTISSTSTLYYGLDTTISVAISLSYFLVDLVAMVSSDGLTNLLSLRSSRLMDYAHHIFGLYWGVVLFVNETTVCDASFGNPYVWLQTNEVSTGFYNWYRLTDSTVAGVLFVKFFFLSRVMFNTLFILPNVTHWCHPLYVLGCSPYFVLQYVWFYMIARKLISQDKKAANGRQHVIEKDKKDA
ncbi:unnamed protein product [Peronospora belbahrii]|uniref:TLC domain-containing protein n=1 Tax=Peronospora belbahrii TaxID=622444 RepID=A0ABN8D6P5_9STRA|nr:unnamed protein product [Peronospora belbahrii]